MPTRLTPHLDMQQPQSQKSIWLDAQQSWPTNSRSLHGRCPARSMQLEANSADQLHAVGQWTLMGDPAMSKQNTKRVPCIQGLKQTEPAHGVLAAMSMNSRSVQVQHLPTRRGQSPSPCCRAQTMSRCSQVISCMLPRRWQHNKGLNIYSPMCSSCTAGQPTPAPLHGFQLHAYSNKSANIIMGNADYASFPMNAMHKVNDRAC